MSTDKIATDNTNQDATKTSNILQATKVIRSTRMEALGIAGLAWKRGKAYLNDALQTGQKALSKEPKTAAENPPESDAKQANINRVAAQLNETTLKARQLGTGLLKKLSEDQKSFRESLTQRLKQADSAGSEEKAATDLRAQWRSLRAQTDQVAKWLNESAEALMADAEKEGKELDLEIRKRIKAAQQELADSYQSALNQMGFAAQKDMQEINRKLIALAEALDKQATSKPGTLISLERRREERRKKQLPVDFEQRVYQRRS